MKKLLWSFLLLSAILTLSGTQLRAETKNKQLLGEWVYEVTDVPYGYEKGSLIFSEKEGKTVCVVKLEAGELTTNDLKIDGDTITFSALVEGSTVKVELTREMNKLVGKVDSQVGLKTVTAVKK